MVFVFINYNLINMNLPEKRTSPLKIISATHINCFSVAIHCPMNPYSDVVLFLFLLLCIIFTSAVKFDNFFSCRHISWGGEFK